MTSKVDLRKIYHKSKKISVISHLSLIWKFCPSQTSRKISPLPQNGATVVISGHNQLFQMDEIRPLEFLIGIMFALENEKKKLEGNSKGGKNTKEVSLQLECDLNEDTYKFPSLSLWMIRNCAKWKSF